jgi:hypothetical protein
MLIGLSCLGILFPLEILLDGLANDRIRRLLADLGEAVNSAVEGGVEIEAAGWFCHCEFFRFFEIPVA